MPVKSTYNFVPAPSEDEVFKPDWADQVSHDIPFSDGESGEITLKITAETPIFIRNGHSKDDAKIFEKHKMGQLPNPTLEEKEAIERYISFSHLKISEYKKYFIPATAIKGMLRNVLEIMSFSRMKQVDDNKFSLRDLSSNKNFYMNQMKSTDGNKTHGGWLKSDKDGNWSISDCGEPARINHLQLKEKFDLGFRDEFLNKEPINDEAKTAKYKYEQVSLQKQFKFNDTFKTIRQETRLKAYFDEEGEEGSIVFTGQPGKRKEIGDNKKNYDGKYYEFVFFSRKNALEIKLTESQKREFLFVYNESDIENVSKDWEFWRKKLEKGESVPVFFKKEKAQIKHFGLSLLYKLPLEYSIHETAPYNSYSSIGLDLAETIFGKTGITNSLKGRVSISNAFVIKNTGHLKGSEILGSPKASYFPFYLDQTKKNGLIYSNFDRASILRGFKRYPVRNVISTGKYTEKQKENKKIFSDFEYLNKETVFGGKIRFHNLKKIEIGALISAITFHQNANAYHTLGGLKSFGYGKVKIEIMEPFSNECLLWFENQMNLHCNSNWLETPQMVELLSIAKNPTKEVEFDLRYPAIENDKKENEFVKYKQAGLYLEKYSKINGTNNTEPLLNKPEWKNVNNEINESIKNSEKKQAERLQLLINLKEKAITLEKQFEFNDAISIYFNLSKIDLKNDYTTKIEQLKIEQSKFEAKKQKELDIELKNTKKLENEFRIGEEIARIILSNNLDLILTAISKYPSHEKIKELREKEIEIRNVNKINIAKKLSSQELIFNSLYFDKLKDYLNSFTKNNKLFQFSEIQKLQIADKLKESYLSEKDNKKSDWRKGFFPKYPWSDIIKWLGQEAAQNLYNELNGN